MIAILDPAWFFRPNPLNEVDLARDIDGLHTVLDEAPAELPIIDDYWQPLWTELGHPLLLRLKTQPAKKALEALQRRARRANLPPLTGPGRVRGCQELFGQTTFLPAVWEDRMGRALLRAVASGSPALLLTRPVVDRNIQRHGAGNLVLDEVTRWCVYAQPGTPEFTPIPCLRMSRQLRTPWTRRFDHRLPGPADGARYPFCPPMNWDDPGLVVVATRLGKPAMVDTLGNGWTRPNIPEGRGYHWDVFIGPPAIKAAVGSHHLNIAEFGIPPSERKAAGSIHHIPSDEQGHIHDVGWKCA